MPAAAALLLLFFRRLLRMSSPLQNSNEFYVGFVYSLANSGRSMDPT